MRHRTRQLVKIALTPLLLLAGYVLSMIILFNLRVPEAAEAALLGLLWMVGLAAGVWIGLRHGHRPPAEPAWLAVVAVVAAALPLSMTRLLGPRLPAVLITLAIWGTALLVLALAVRALRRTGPMIVGGAVAIGGLLLVVTMPFLSARLHLPATEVPWASAPWWLPVSVTDHNLVHPDLVNRIDAVQVTAGVSVLLMLGTAYVLAYIVASTGAGAGRLGAWRPRLPKTVTP